MKLSPPERVVIAIAVIAAVFTLGFFTGRGTGGAFVVETEKQVTLDSPASAEGEPSASAGTNTPDASANPESSGGKVNINTADSAQSQTLPGIGEVLALRIIAFRETNGNFTITDEIMDVAGIGEAVFNNLEPLITVE